MTLISRAFAVILAVLAPSIAASECLPPALMNSVLKGIEIAPVLSDRVESQVEVGEDAGVLVARLSRQYYQITAVSGNTDAGQDQIIFGSVLADLSVLDPAATGTKLSSFVLRREENSIEILCVDDSILSDQLLVEEVRSLLAEEVKDVVQHE